MGDWYFAHNIKTSELINKSPKSKIVLFQPKIFTHLTGTYPGLGKILGYIDSTHLMSINEDLNCLYTISHDNTDIPLPNSLLNAHAFWESADYKKLMEDFGITNSLKRRNALILSDDQWPLGVWEENGSFINRNENSMMLMQELNIDAFVINKQNKLIRSYYMNPENANDQAEQELLNVTVNSKPYIACNKGALVKGRPILNEFDQLAAMEYVYKYAEAESDGLYLYSPCSIICPLQEMQMSVNCLCKFEGNQKGYDDIPQQLEFFNKEENDFLANGALTDDGLVIYKCNSAVMNSSNAKCDENA